MGECLNKFENVHTMKYFAAEEEQGEKKGKEKEVFFVLMQKELLRYIYE